MLLHDHNGRIYGDSIPELLDMASDDAFDNVMGVYGEIWGIFKWLFLVALFVGIWLAWHALKLAVRIGIWVIREVFHLLKIHINEHKVNRLHQRLVSKNNQTNQQSSYIFNHSNNPNHDNYYKYMK